MHQEQLKLRPVGHVQTPSGWRGKFFAIQNETTGTEKSESETGTLQVTLKVIVEMPKLNLHIMQMRKFSILQYSVDGTLQ